MQMSTRKGSTDVHEFDGTFHGSYANFKVTSVIGHVLRFCFILQFFYEFLSQLHHLKPAYMNYFTYTFLYLSVEC